MFFYNFYKKGKLTSKGATTSTLGPNKRQKFRRYKG